MIQRKIYVKYKQHTNTYNKKTLGEFGYNINKKLKNKSVAIEHNHTVIKQWLKVPTFSTLKKKTSSCFLLSFYFIFQLSK